MGNGTARLTTTGAKIHAQKESEFPTKETRFYGWSCGAQGHPILPVDEAFTLAQAVYR
jgi:hypothetical protein